MKQRKGIFEPCDSGLLYGVLKFFKDANLIIGNNYVVRFSIC